LGGQTSDLRSALKDLSDASTSSLDKAIESARSDGAEVERADWEFPDWKPGKDYTY
jgi:multiple sugar transport system substrate-binding protein